MLLGDNPTLLNPVVAQVPTSRVHLPLLGRALGFDDAARVRAELHSMFVYGEVQLFLPASGLRTGRLDAR